MARNDRQTDFIVFNAQEAHSEKLLGLASSPEVVHTLLAVAVAHNNWSVSIRYNSLRDTFSVALRSTDVGENHETKILTTFNNDLFKAFCQIVLAIQLTEETGWDLLKQQSTLDW